MRAATAYPIEEDVAGAYLCTAHSLNKLLFGKQKSVAVQRNANGKRVNSVNNN